MRKFWLTLTNARVKAVLRALRASGQGIGELVDDPAAAQVFFRPLRAALAAGSAAPASSTAASRALAAAEDFTVRLEFFFSYLALHKTAPDAPAREALLYLQQACGEAPGLLSLKGRADASARIRGLCAGAHKSLALARAAAESSPDGFPQNLKFSSIYSGLDAVFNAYGSCAGALFEI